MTPRTPSLRHLASSFLLLSVSLLCSGCTKNDYTDGSGDLTVVGEENQSVSVDLDATFGTPSSPWLLTVPPDHGVASVSGETLTLTPPADWVGVMTTVVADGSAGTRHVIEAVIEPVDDAPQIVGLPAAAHANSAYPAHLAFDLIDVDTPVDSLVLDVGSSDVQTLPVSALTLTGNGTHRELLVSPPASATPGTLVTVTVSATDTSTTTEVDVVITVGAPSSTPLLVTSASWGGPTEAGSLIGLEIDGSGAGTAHVVESFPGTPFSVSRFEGGLGNEYGSFLELTPSGSFFAAATWGGPANAGALFQINPVTMERQVLWTFGQRPQIIFGDDVRHPVGKMVKVGSKVFGLYQSGTGGIWAYDLATDSFEVVLTFDATSSSSHSGPMPFLGNEVQGGLEMCSNGRLFGTTDRDGILQGHGVLYSFDPTRPNTDPNNPYAFQNHYSFTGGFSSPFTSLAFEDSGPYGWSFDAGVRGMSYFDSSNGFGPFPVNGFFGLGFGSYSVDFEPSRHAVFMTLENSYEPQGDERGELIRAAGQTDIRSVHTFSDSSGNAAPFALVAIGSSHLVGLSSRPSLKLWETDSFNISPAVRGSYGQSEVDRMAGGLGGGGDYAFAWVHAGLEVSPPFLLSYDAARGDVRETPVGYPRGAAPRGGVTAHPNGSYYCALQYIQPAQSPILTFGGLPASTHAAIGKWDPLSGNLQTARIIPQPGPTDRDPNSLIDLRPVVHPASGDLYAVLQSDHPSQLQLGHAVFRVDPTTLSATEIAFIDGGSDIEGRQGGTIVGDELYFFAQKTLHSLDVTSPTAVLRDTLTYLPLGRPTLVGGTSLFWVSPEGPSGNGSVYRYEIGSGGSVVHDFSASGLEGVSPETTLILAADGLLYGVAQTAGGGGVLFSIDPSTNAYAKVVDIPDTDGPGATPRGELIQLANGDLWGQAIQDGGDAEDSCFSFRYTLTSGSPTLTTFPITRDKGFGNSWPELTEIDVADQLQVP